MDRTNGSTRYELKGRYVSADMHHDATVACRSGRRVFLTRAIPGEGEPLFNRRVAYCTNCDSFGKLALHIVYSGPFNDIPAHVKDKAVGDQDGAVLAAPRYLDGKWWLMTMRLYTCPVCHGSGTLGQAPAPAHRPALAPVANDVAEPDFEVSF